MNWLLKGLNEAQQAAVETVDGPLLIIAGAGSGKTRVLTSRLAHILTQRLAEPYQILAVTFTNKAAGEMRQRVTQILGADIPELQVSTFHSFCARLLRRDAEALGYRTNFTIFDDADSQTLAKQVIKELGYNDSQFPARGQMRKISDAKNRLIGPEAFAQSSSGYFESRTAEIYKLYQQRLRSCNAMDFDDLLCNATRLLRDIPEVGDRYRRRFKYLMVDEYQDTNHVQYLLLKQLLGGHGNICVVGDEDQSIYGWRGADIRNILDFEKDFPNAKVIKLEQNYRSTSVILMAASAVIKNNQMRKGKTLWTSSEGGEKLDLLLVDSADDEAVHIVDRIASATTRTTLKETVILYRTNGQSRPFEEQLRRRNLPYQIIGGVSFYQRKEIKDLMAYLKLLVNPADDIAFGRIINFPKRGIGEKTISDIESLAQRDKKPSYEIVMRAAEYPELATKARRLEPFVELIEKHRRRVTTEPVDLITQDLVTELGLINELMADDPIQGQTRVESIEAFIEGTVEFAKGHPNAHLVDYLNDISLFTDLDTYKEIDDKVTLMTLHGAKGLEFDTVFLVGLEEGLFPLQRATLEPDQLEEERRLFYVGATRAKKKIFLSSASTRFRFGEVESIPSRFIREIPADLVDKVDLRRARHFERESVAPSMFSKPKQDVGVHYEYEEQSVFRAGKFVEHPTFGRGRITSVDGFGESLRLEILFTGVGTKKIMAKFAKLRVVG